MKFRWPWIVLPVGLGAAAGLVLHFSTITDPLIYVQAKLSLLVFGLSILISLALGGMYLREKRDQDIVKIAEKEFSEDRRRFLQRLDHELKNPLTAVLAGLANLSLIENPDERTETLESVSVQVSGKLLVGFPDVNSTRIEVSSLEVIEEGSEVQPTLETSFDPTADYQVYTNNRYGYQFKYPDRATLSFFGPDTFSPNDLPEGMTSEEYLETLQKTYTDQLCVQIEYSLGYIYISAVPNNTEDFMVDCGNTESFSGEILPLERTISIGSETYLAQGFEFTGTGETLDQHNELLWINLEDGNRIAFGATSRTDANYEDYLMKTQIILEQILSTYQPLQ